LETMNGLVNQNDDETIEEALPGMFIIGDDGTGGLFFYDPKNKLGKGEYGLFCVKMGVMSFEYSVYVAATLTEAFRLVRGRAESRKRAEGKRIGSLSRGGVGCVQFGMLALEARHRDGVRNLVVLCDLLDRLIDAPLDLGGVVSGEVERLPLRLANRRAARREP